MTTPDSHTILSSAAMVVMGALGLAVIFFTVPPSNHDIILVIVSALGGALGFGGGSKLADKFTNSIGPDAKIQADAPADPHPPA